MSDERTAWVPLSQIVLHPRVRPHSPAKLKELMESMKTRKQLQPVRGRLLPDGRVELYIGQGRYLSAHANLFDAMQSPLKIKPIPRSRFRDRLFIFLPLPSMMAQPA